MSARERTCRNSILAIAAMLAIGAAGSSLAAGVGHAVGGGGGYHGGFHGGYYGGGHAYSGWHGSYGGWRGGYYGGWRGGYYGGAPWRGGWAGWGGWGYPWVGLGWSVPVLPWGYQTVWWGGYPYYYANNYYYAWDSGAGQYEAVQPPSSGATPSTPSSPAAPAPGRWTDLFAYPKGGQSKEQQLRDREECHKWAVEQSGFDPSQPSHENANDWATKRESYLRAEAACLQARNYSVK